MRRSRLTQGVRHLQAEMSQTADSNDTDLLSRSGAEALEGRVGGHSGAQEGGDGLAVERFGDGDGEASTAASVVGVCSRSRSISVREALQETEKTHILPEQWIHPPTFPLKASKSESASHHHLNRSTQLTVGPDHSPVTKLLLPLIAELAVEAASTLCSNSNAISDLVSRPRASAHNRSDYLVANDGVVVGRRRPAVGEDVDVAAAHAAVGDANVDVVFSEVLGRVCVWAEVGAFERKEGAVRRGAGG
jgi:hypothetical protein